MTQRCKENILGSLCIHFSVLNKKQASIGYVCGVRPAPSQSTCPSWKESRDSGGDDGSGLSKEHCGLPTTLAM